MSSGGPKSQAQQKNERTKQQPATSAGQQPTIMTTAFLPLDSLLLQRAMADPRALPPTDILRLQRTVGNRAVQRLLASGDQSSEQRAAFAPIGQSGRMPSRTEGLAAQAAIQRKNGDKSSSGISKRETEQTSEEESAQEQRSEAESEPEESNQKEAEGTDQSSVSPTQPVSQLEYAQQTQAKIKSEIDALLKRRAEYEAEIKDVSRIRTHFKRIEETRVKLQKIIDKMEARLTKSRQQWQEIRKEREDYDILVERYEWFKARPEPVLRKVVSVLRSHKHSLERKRNAWGREEYRANTQKLLAELEKDFDLVDVIEELERDLEKLSAAKKSMTRLVKKLRDELEREQTYKEIGAIVVDVYPTETEEDVEEMLKEIERLYASDPKRQKQVNEELASAKEKQKAVERVIKLEQEYRAHARDFDTLLKEWNFLSEAGTSAGVGISLTFSFGLAKGIGKHKAEAALDLSLGVSGSVATGDDYKVRPNLSFTVGCSVGIDVTAWKISAGISLTFTMAETYDSLEHFVAHYMGILATFARGIRAYRLYKLQRMKRDPKIVEAQKALQEEAAREGRTLQSGTVAYQQIEKLQQQAPVKIKAASVKGEAGMEVGIKKVAKLGLTASASYQYKHFTRAVSAEEYRQANFGQNKRKKPLENLPHQLNQRVDKIFEWDAKSTMPILTGYDKGHIIDEMKTLTDPALDSIDKVLHFHSALGKAFSRQKTNEQINARRAEVFKELVDRQWDTTQAWAKRESLEKVSAQPPTGKTEDVKKLTKTGDVLEIVLSGSVELPFVEIGLAGKWTRIRGDANPDNNGKYLNLKLSFSRAFISHTTVNPELMDPEDAQDALDSVEETLTALREMKEFAINDEKPDNIIGSIDTLLNGTSLANIKAQEVAGTLCSLGLNIELNFINPAQSHLGLLGYKLQYARLTADTKSDVGAKGIPLGPEGVSMGISGERSKTKALKEFIGTHTLSYVQTAYLGMKKHPKWTAEWQSWTRTHREGLWSLFRRLKDPNSNVRKEVAGNDEGAGFKVGGKDFATLKRELFEASQKVTYTFIPGSDQIIFDDVLQKLQNYFDCIALARSSLKREDLAKAGWRGGEEGQKRAKITINLAGGVNLEAVEVGSDWWIARKVKGYSEPQIAQEFVRLYKSLGDLYFSGAAVKFKFKLPDDQVVRAAVKVPDNVPIELAKGFYRNYDFDSWRAFPKNVAPVAEFAELHRDASKLPRWEPTGESAAAAEIAAYSYVEDDGWPVWKAGLKQRVMPKLWEELGPISGLEGKVKGAEDVEQDD